MNYLDLTIKEIHQAYVDGKITPLELIKESLERAKNNKDNCFEVITEEFALSQVEKLGGVEPDNMLWGIPYVLKDNFSSKDIPTCASSNILKGYTPIFDSTVKAKLDAKKAILIGKTTLDELAMGGSGTTGHLGKTYNPYDPKHERQIGGSSCGSASATASCIVPLAIGSDTGDSVRKPASFGGLVGIKPSWGRISRYGLFPFATSLDHVAYFTRSVEDSAMVLEALAGHDENDSTSSFKPVEKYSEFVGKNGKELRIAVIKDILDTITDPIVLNHMTGLISQLRAQKYVVDFVEFGKDLLEAILPTYMVISCSEAASNNANLDGIKFGEFKGGATYQEVMSNARTQGFSELIKRRFVIGSFALMKDNQNELFIRASKARNKIVKRANEIFSSYDFMIAPAAPTVAIKFDNKADQLSDNYLIADNHMAIGNFGGFPSITLPMGLEDNLPLGVNITGKPFEEAKLFTISKIIEDTTGLYNLSVNNIKEAKI